MNFQTLNTFKLAAHLQNLSEVAKQLNITQPALSRTIKQMESEIGFCVFQHSQNKITLNRNGEKFLEVVEDILNQYEICIREIREDNGISTNTLTLSLSSGSLILTDVIHQFKAENPSAKFIIKNRKPSSANADLDTDSDFIFLSSYQEFTNGFSTLLDTQELYVTVGRHHPLASRKKVKLSDLANENFLYTDADNDLHDIQIHYCQKAGFSPLYSNIIEKQFILLLLLKLNEGIAILPDMKDPELVQLPIEDVDCIRYVYMVSNKNVFQTKIAKLFKQFCINYFLDAGH